MPAVATEVQELSIYWVDRWDESIQEAAGCAIKVTDGLASVEAGQRAMSRMREVASVCYGRGELVLLGPDGRRHGRRMSTLCVSMS